jgi:2'-5' RNA ligase
MASKRLFVSLIPPPPVAQDLVRLDPRLRGVRWVGAEQIHLTLAFLGPVGSEEGRELSSQLATVRFGPFFLPLEGIGTFPGKGWPRVIWLGVGAGHPHLFQLHKRVIDAALAAGLQPDLSPWRPHFTLARCAKVSPEAIRSFLQAHADFSLGLIPFNVFHLQSSQLTPAGSEYRVELTVPA